MKKICFVLLLLSVSFLATAKQKVQYFRYNFTLNVAEAAQQDLEKLINSGNKIIGFSLDYSQKYMIVCYDDQKEL